MKRVNGATRSSQPLMIVVTDSVFSDGPHPMPTMTGDAARGFTADLNLGRALRLLGRGSVAR